MTIERTARKPLLALLGVALVMVVIIVSTTKTKTTMGMRFYENTTFKFMVSIVPHEAVHPSGQRFWVATWPGNTKCVAGVGVPLAHRQFTFHILRLSWRG